MRTRTIGAAPIPFTAVWDDAALFSGSLAYVQCGIYVHNTHICVSVCVSEHIVYLLAVHVYVCRYLTEWTRMPPHTREVMGLLHGKNCDGQSCANNHINSSARSGGIRAMHAVISMYIMAIIYLHLLGKFTNITDSYISNALRLLLNDYSTALYFIRFSNHLVSLQAIWVLVCV